MCRGTGAAALAEALQAAAAAPARAPARPVELPVSGRCGLPLAAWPGAGRAHGRRQWAAFADAQPTGPGKAAPDGATATPGGAPAAKAGGSKGSGAAGAAAGDGGDDDGDADDEDADEGADQEDDESASQAVAMAKQVVEASKKVDAESSASRARLSELEQTVGAAESRRTAAEVGSSARGVLAHPWRLNKALRELYVDRDTLADSAKDSGAFHGRPFTERADLERLAADADHARALLESSVEPARRALRQIEDIDDESMGHAHIRFDEVQKVGPPRGEPDEPQPAVRTSAGCLCDPVSKCASAGQPFSWCHVHAPADGKEGECPLHDHIKAAEAAEEADGDEGVEALVGGDGLDPTGRPHDLAHDRHQVAEGEGPAGGGPVHLWDYCVPPEAQLTESMAHPGASKTVHPNCRCAPRPDVLARYENDPAFFGPSGNGDLDPNRVPFRDRITVEAMLEHERSPGADLCKPTPSSSGWGVCPVAKECGKPPSRKTGAGANPGAWFSDVAGRSWDFCVPRSPPADAHQAAAPGEAVQQAAALAPAWAAALAPAVRAPQRATRRRAHAAELWSFLSTAPRRC